MLSVYIVLMMRYRITLQLNGIEFKMEISAPSKKMALKSMLDTARIYPDKRMTIVSIEQV